MYFLRNTKIFKKFSFETSPITHSHADGPAAVWWHNAQGPSLVQCGLDLMGSDLVSVTLLILSRHVAYF